MKINNKKPQSRRTRQRAALREVFAAAEGPLSAREAHRRASRRGAPIGIATAYRAVARWVASGWLVPVEVPGGTTRYERSDLAHHHHFHCDRCEQVFDVVGCAKGLGRLVPPGFRARSHQITIHGLCRECESRRRRARPKGNASSRAASDGAKRKADRPSEARGAN